MESLEDRLAKMEYRVRKIEERRKAIKDILSLLFGVAIWFTLLFWTRL